MQTLKAEHYELKGGEYRIIRERAQAESPLEAEVLRQAIMADKWDLTPEHAALLGSNCFAHPARLCSSGGQAVLHTEFKEHVVWHYCVGGQVSSPGFFELTVAMVDSQNGKQLASFKLLACLALLRRPPFQTGWDGTAREFFVCPWWYYFSANAEAQGLAFKTNVKDFDNGPLFVSSLTKARAEWDCLSPHARLIEPFSIVTEPSSPSK